MNIKFCGADRTVTGSSHLLTLDSGFKILLDCGMYQGNEDEYRTFNEEWIYDPAEIDILLLSQAHIDHSGRIPKLVKDGFKGKIICTSATLDLSTIMLKDSAYIQEHDAAYENKWREKRGKELVKPLYTVEDAEVAMQQFVPIEYDKWFSISEEVEVIYRDNGHILGSASVTLKIFREYGDPLLFGFTGDIGRPDRPIIKDPKHMPEVDYLITESTYGGEKHPPHEKEKDQLLEVIKSTCVDNHGKLLIPAFSVGRTQTIVYLMDQLFNEGKLPPIPIFVDSPLAVNATDIFRNHPECFDAELHAYMKNDPSPFGFSKLHYINKVEDSKALNDMDGPAVIISASGMMEGGRIRHHIFNNISNPSTTLLIVGFCPDHTLGGALRNGAKKIHLFGQELEVKARIEIMDSFSAHGDQDEMLQFLDNQSRSKLRKIFMVHGEYPKQVKFRDALMEKGFHHIEIPVIGREERIG